jgi:hypothetical protein
MMNRLKTVLRDIRVNRGARRMNRPAEFVPLIFRRLRGSTVIQHHEWRTPVLLALRIETAAVVLASPVARRTPYSTSTVVQQVTRRDEIIERVVRRQIRIETSATPPYQPVGNLAQPAVTPARVSSPMILRTPPPAPAVTHTMPTAEAAADFPKMQTRPAKLDMNAIDINRLTEQVVTAIDRRISARRERTGRY